MGQWIAVADEDQCPPGSLLELVVEGQIVVLVNTDGQYFAIDGICAHQGGPLSKGALEGCTLTCPWHGWQYDIRTGRQLLSSTIAQRTFPVRSHAGRIEVQLPSQA